MATTITIKNSSVAGKVPDVDSIQVAELALNLADKKLYSKNASDEVFEVNSVVNSGDTLPGAGTNPGDLFWDTEDETLYYWDGTQWQAIATGSDVEGEYLKLTGGDLTGDLTLGTNKITLDATDGSITAAGTVSAYNNGSITGKTTPAFTTGNGAGSNIRNAIFPDGSQAWGGDGIFANGKATIDGPTGSITAAGDVKIGGTSASPNITLNANGKITAAGKIQSGGNANTGAAAGCLTNPEGNFQVARSNAPGNIFQGYTVGTSAPTIAITAGGSITAAGDVKIGGTLPSSPNIELNADGSAEFKRGIWVARDDKDGYLTVTQGVNSQAAFNVIDNAGTPTAVIYGGGSATFAGNITAGAFSPSDANAGGSRVYASGALYTQKPTGDPGNIGMIRVYQGTDITANIMLNGSATFKGDVAIGDSTTTFLDKAAIIAALTEEQRETFAAAITAWNNQPEPYDAEDPTTLPADTPLREAIVRVTTAGKINLNADGSITAAGTIKSTKVNQYSFLMANPSNTAQTSGGLWQSDVGAAVLYLKNKFDVAPTVTLDGSDGSATFSGDVQSGTYDNTYSNANGGKLTKNGTLYLQQSGVGDALVIYKGLDENITLNTDGTVTARGYSMASLAQL